MSRGRSKPTRAELEAEVAALRARLAEITRTSPPEGGDGGRGAAGSEPVGTTDGLEQADQLGALESLARAAGTTLFRIGADGQVGYVSRDWTDLTKDPGPPDWLALLHPDDRGRVVASWQAAVAKGERWECDFRVQVAAGTRQVQARAEPLGAAGGAGGNYLGFATDITGRRETEVELLRTRSLFLAAIEQSPAGILIADAPDGTIRLANSAALGIRGESDRPLTDIPAEQHPANWQTYHPDGSPYRPEDLPLTRAIAEGLTIRNQDVIIRRSDGEERWVLGNAAPVRNASGEVIAGVVVFPDITDRKRAERELTVRDRALQTASNGIIITDARSPNQPIIYANHGFETITGYSREEAIGQNCRFLQGPERDQPELAELRSALEDGRETRVILRNYRKDGTPFWNELFITPVRDASGQLTHFIGVQNDVSERIDAHEQLRESEARLRSIIDHAPFCIHEIDLDGRLLSINRAGLEMLRLGDATAVLGQPYLNAVGGDDREAVAALLRRAMGGEESHFTFRTIVAGEPRHFSSCFVPIVGMDGAVGRLMGISEDITERQRDEEEILELQLAVENAMVGISKLDAAGVFSMVRADYAAMLGYTSDELAGQPWTVTVPEEDRPAGAAAHVRMMAEGRAEVELPVLRKDSSRFYASLLLVKSRGRDGDIDGHYCLMRDITARRKAEEQSLVLEERLRQAHKMEALGQLAGGVAHDFNNSLTAILANIELVLQTIAGGRVEGDEKAIAGCLEQARYAAERATATTQQLLAFSRKEVTQAAVIDPRLLLRETSGMLKPLIGEHIEVEFAATGRAHVLADPSQLQQIMVNLVVNAADAMPRGGCLRVALDDVDLGLEHAAAHPGATLGHHVRLTVSDTGCGMEPALVERAFEPFFTTKPVGKGTGLGLATVYGATQHLGGHITVKSTPGEGSTFCVYLPVAPASDDAPQEPASSPDGARGEIVLLCEDDRQVRSVTERALSMAGYTVLLAKDGKDALEVAAAHPGRIDLLVTDLVMPEMNGRDLAGAIRDARPETRSLYISGYTSDVIDGHGIKDTQADFLQKPFTLSSLLARVREILDSRTPPMGVG